MDKNLKSYLEKFNIEYEEFKHDAVFTVEESLKSGKDKSVPGLHCKCLFLKSDTGNYYLVGMPALKRLDMKSLRKELGVRKLYFASEKELFDKLGLKPGSVSIFGLVNNKEKDVVFILDREVWNAERVGFHPNINTSTLVLDHENLEKFFNSVKNQKNLLKL